MTATEPNILDIPFNKFNCFFFLIYFLLSLQYHELLQGRRVNPSSSYICPESAANRQTFGGGVPRSARQTPAGDSSFLPAWGVWAGVRDVFPFTLCEGVGLRTATAA